MRCHFIALVAVLLTAAAAPAPLQAAGSAASQNQPAPAPAPAAPAPGEATFRILISGREVGRQTANVSRDPSGWVITSTGRLEPPLDLTVNHFEMKYGSDWQPLELKLDAILRRRSVALATSFSMTTAINEITEQGQTVSKEDQISARSVIVPNQYWGAYEALAARLWTIQSGAQIPLYIAPSNEVVATVESVTDQSLSSPAGVLKAKAYSLTIDTRGGKAAVNVVVDEHARLVRLDMPASGLSVVRDDASGVNVRTQTARNATDSDVTIPSNGFTLAGTMTTPPTVAGRLRSPAILLVGGVTRADRDENISGVPIFAQLAGSLASSGAIVLRYDKRGSGQSGGRSESATLSDYADDAVTAMKWLSKRPDVDKRRMVIVGYTEGAAVALMAAAKSKDIKGVVTIAGAGVKGSDLLLEQQQHELDQLKLNATEKQERVDLQKKIVAAVLSGTGWDQVPPDLKAQADVPWFRSVLAYDPAVVVAKVKQPLLIIQGDLDRQVPKEQADKLETIAKARKKVAAPQVTHLEGLNHLLVPATTGETAEYKALKDKTVSPKVGSTITDWIKMTLP